METLTYWVTRLEPLIRSDNRDEIIVIFCNRAGVEDDVTYAGTSAVIGILDGEVKVYGLLGRGEKELLVVDTNKAPYARLVHRPSEKGAPTHPGLLAKPDGRTQHHQEQNGGGGTPSTDSHLSPGRESKSDDISTRSPSQKKRAAPIIVPRPGTMASSRSPTADYNIPTPSAPSPTPMAVRPKLIIPASPPISPEQTPSDCPLSASSSHSTQSYRSEDSEASTQTVRSNPRPPEDSTPYPNAPLSGYPDNRWETGKQIYGGNVTISHHETLSPTTPFENNSPIAVRHFWGPPEYPTPVGRKPEPFPWSEITGQPDARHANSLRSKQQKQQKRQETQQEVTKLGNSAWSLDPPVSTTLNSQTDSPMPSHTLAGQVASQSDYSQTAPKVSPRSFRPSSPKSRNASRPSLDEGFGQNLNTNELDTNPTTATNLPQDARCAGSANSIRGNPTPSSTKDTVVERPSSPKSRNCSRSRPSESGDFSSVDPHMIPIVASPSIFRGDASTPGTNGVHRSLTRANFQQPSRSLSHSGVAPRSRGGTPTKSKTVPSITSRPASRGRQRQPRDADAPAQERTSSKDSILNNQLHTRVRRRESLDSRRASQSGRRSSRSSSQQTPLAHYERIEVVSRSSCPVHGQYSDSSADERCDREWGGGQEHHLNSASCSGETHVLNAHFEKTPTQTEQADAFAQTTIQQAPVASEVSQMPENYAEASGDASSETAQTSSSGRSSGTPSNFDPPTPKAMAFNANEVPLTAAHSSDTTVKDFQISAKVV